jgi:hypothetical protein
MLKVRVKINMALPFPLCETTFMVGWVEVRNPTLLTILSLMLGFLASTQPTLMILG